MFYQLSKIFFFLVTPLGIFLVLLLFALYSKNSATIKKLLWGVCLGMYISSIPIVVNFLHLRWEEPPTPRKGMQEYDVAIILTGGMMNEEKEPQGNLFLSTEADRFAQALSCYQEKKIKKIVISGGLAVNFQKPTLMENRLVATYLIKNGVKAEDILVDTLSRNTHENAVKSKKILTTHFPNQRYLLFTSATHLPRASACFRKEGVKHDKFGTSYTSHPPTFSIKEFVPNADSFHQFTKLCHEYIGYVIYWFCGYI